MPLLRTPLDDLLSSRSKLRILRLLCTTTSPLSGREVARRAGAAWRAAYLALQELVAIGVVANDQTRGQAQYRLNQSHTLVASALLPLFGAEDRWQSSLTIELGRCIERAARTANVDVRWAAIFGSTARGDDTPASDLDLAVVLGRTGKVADFTDALHEQGRAFESHVGRRVSPTVIAVSQLRRLHRARSPLVDGWRADARRICGTLTLESLLQ